MQISRGNTDNTGRYIRKLRSRGFYDALTGSIKTGINAENANHGRWHARIVPLLAAYALDVAPGFIAARKRWAALPCLGVGH